MPKSVGLFEVIMKNVTVACKLKLPETIRKLQTWCNVSWERPYNAGGMLLLVPTPAVMSDDEMEFFIE